MIITFLITAGQRHEQSQFCALMEQGAIKRRGRGRPRIRPARVVGDKGYSGGPIRRYPRRPGHRRGHPDQEERAALPAL